jgi:hypothetical protein
VFRIRIRFRHRQHEIVRHSLFGGVWAVGVTSNKANNSTLIAYHR